MNERIVHFVADRVMTLVKVYAALGRHDRWPRWLRIASYILFPITIVYFTLYYVIGFIGLVSGMCIGMPILMIGPLYARCRDKIKKWQNRN